MCADALAYVETSVSDFHVNLVKSEKRPGQLFLELNTAEEPLSGYDIVLE